MRRPSPSHVTLALVATAPPAGDLFAEPTKIEHVFVDGRLVRIDEAARTAGPRSGR